MVRGRLTCKVLVMVAALGQGGCASMADGSLLKPGFWDSSPLIGDSREAKLGYGELMSGNYQTAESYFMEALNRNRMDVHALLGMGLLYQEYGQNVKAREMYEAILAIRPADEERKIPLTDLKTRSVSEIASLNLAMLEGGGERAPKAAPRVAVTGAPVGSPMLGRATGGGAALGGPEPGPDDGLQMNMSLLSSTDRNIASRFKTLMALRDAGLVTGDEYKARRQANIGALLPLSSPPPATGLDQPTPDTEAVVGRLMAIRRALEMRAMTVSQHAAERTTILDAMLPEAPVRVANPAPPPKGLMEAADAVRRLEILRDSKIVTSDEYTRERAEIEKSMQPAAPAAAPGGTAGAGGGTGPALHVASFRSPQQASKGWAQLKRAHGDLLGGFGYTVRNVNLGPGKGDYYRLLVGPVESRAKAQELCRQLKRRKAYCEPSVAEFSGGKQ